MGKIKNISYLSLATLIVAGSLLAFPVRRASAKEGIRPYDHFELREENLTANSIANRVSLPRAITGDAGLKIDFNGDFQSNYLDLDNNNKYTPIVISGNLIDGDKREDSLNSKDIDYLISHHYGEPLIGNYLNGKGSLWLAQEAAILKDRDGQLKKIPYPKRIFPHDSIVTEEGELIFVAEDLSNSRPIVLRFNKDALRIEILREFPDYNGMTSYSAKIYGNRDIIYLFLSNSEYGKSDIDTLFFYRNEPERNEKFQFCDKCYILNANPSPKGVEISYIDDKDLKISHFAYYKSLSDGPILTPVFKYEQPANYEEYSPSDCYGTSASSLDGEKNKFAVNVICSTVNYPYTDTTSFIDIVRSNEMGQVHKAKSISHERIPTKDDQGRNEDASAVHSGNTEKMNFYKTRAGKNFVEIHSNAGSSYASRRGEEEVGYSLHLLEDVSYPELDNSTAIIDEDDYGDDSNESILPYEESTEKPKDTSKSSVVIVTSTICCVVLIALVILTAIQDGRRL